MDVVGYSRLMGHDESGTLACLNAHRHALIDPKISEFDGRIVKTTGDGLLLEFASVVDAVRCAVDVQRGMAERNAGVPAADRIEFRIGINIGDIISEGDDIFGDGVNVAARLQTLAEPGGICVSRTVRDHVIDKLSFVFDDLGAQGVKNIARPVEVYRVNLGGSARRPHGASDWVARLLRRTWTHGLVVAVIAFGLVGIALWITVTRLWPLAPTPMSPALSMAILPFTAPGGSAADQQFAERLTQDLTTLLGQWRFGTVAAPRPASISAGQARDTRALARELNVRFLIEGEVLRAGDETVVTTTLIDGASAMQVWNDRRILELSRPAKDPVELAAQLSRALRAALVKAESQRAGGAAASGASAVELTLRAARLENEAGDPLAGAIEAGRLYDEAIRLDPAFAAAMVARVDNLHSQFWMVTPDRAHRERLVAQMDALSQRAVALDDKYPGAWYARTMALYLQGRFDAALEANAQFLRLDRYRGAPLVQRAWMMLYTGRTEEALDLANQAFARGFINTFEESFALGTRCAVQLRRGRYDEAIADCEKSLASQDSLPGLPALVAAYAQKGEVGKAAAAKARLLQLQPTYSIAVDKARQASDNATYVEQSEAHLYAGLRKAGVPE